jgi:glucose-6-phosphate 1-epimerase
MLKDPSVKYRPVADFRLHDRRWPSNPWQHGAGSLSDLGEDEWQQMTCVEASNVLRSAVRPGRGEGHTMRANLSMQPE